MIVVMASGCTAEQVDHVRSHLTGRGLEAHLSEGVERVVIGVIGQIYTELRDELELMPGVSEVVRISKPYKLASREFHPSDSIVEIRGGAAKIGGGEFCVFAGPCAIESEEQLVETAKAVKSAGATVLRGGAFKPRTSPYSFRGMGEDGLKLMDTARAETGLPLITEVMSERDVDLVERYSDVLQVGARNMQNFALLDQLGETGKPVMVKRGFAATYEDWLLAAEYVMAKGNNDVILCERGVRTFESFTRNTMDINAIPVIRRLSHLPIVADPSHATGKWYLVSPIAFASVAAGADGLIIEVHPSPDTAMSDGAQSLTFENFTSLMERAAAIRRVLTPVTAG